MLLVYLGSMYLYIVCEINTSQWKYVHMLANVWLFVIINNNNNNNNNNHDDLWKYDMGSFKMGSKISILTYIKNWLMSWFDNKELSLIVNAIS